MPDLEVSLELLRGCAGTARRVGTDAAPIADRFTATDDAVGRHGDFGSAQALEACRLAWSGRIRQDAADVTVAGDLLAETAESYTGADAGAATRLHRIDYELPL